MAAPLAHLLSEEGGEHLGEGFSAAGEDVLKVRRDPALRFPGLRVGPERGAVVPETVGFDPAFFEEPRRAISRAATYGPGQPLR